MRFVWLAVGESGRARGHAALGAGGDAVGHDEPPRPRGCRPRGTLVPPAAAAPPSQRSCSPRFSRASLRRRDAAPFSRARGRRHRRLRRPRAPGPNAINAAVVNERRPRPGGRRPLIGRVADDDRKAHGGGALHALAAGPIERASVEDVAFSARRHSPRAKSVFIYQ